MLDLPARRHGVWVSVMDMAATARAGGMLQPRQAMQGVTEQGNAGKQDQRGPAEDRTRKRNHETTAGASRNNSENTPAVRPGLIMPVGLFAVKGANAISLHYRRVRLSHGCAAIATVDGRAPGAGRIVPALVSNVAGQARRAAPASN